MEPNEFTIEELEKVFSETPKYGKRPRVKPRKIVQAPSNQQEINQDLDEPPQGESTPIYVFEERMKRISLDSLQSLYAEINQIHDTVEGSKTESSDGLTEKKTQNTDTVGTNGFSKPQKGKAFHVEPSSRTVRLLARKAQKDTAVKTPEANQEPEQEPEPATEGEPGQPIEKEADKEEPKKKVTEKKVKTKPKPASKKIPKAPKAPKAPRAPKVAKAPKAQPKVAKSKLSSAVIDKPLLRAKSPSPEPPSPKSKPIFVDIWIKTKRSSYKVRKYQELLPQQRSNMTHAQFNAMFPGKDPFNMLQ